jgi:enoyl-CoA hydratase/carnithine racemase
MIEAADLSEPFDEIHYVKDGHLAVITLDRPEAGNSLTPAMHSYMRAVWEDVKRDDTVRCVVVTGSGERHFCTGVDVRGIAARGATSTTDGPLTDEVFWSPRQCNVWKPVICAVNGLAGGAGLHFVVDSDIVVAADTAAFVDTHVNVGMVGAIENIGLAQRLPLGTALRMTLQGKNYRLPAARAYALGLVDEIVPSEELMRTARQIADDIIANSPKAVSLSKQAVWGSLEQGYAQATEYGWALLRMHWSHPDFTEGPRAFAERRQPKWTAS